MMLVVVSVESFLGSPSVHPFLFWLGGLSGLGNLSMFPTSVAATTPCIGATAALRSIQGAVGSFLLGWVGPGSTRMTSFGGLFVCVRLRSTVLSLFVSLHSPVDVSMAAICVEGRDRFTLLKLTTSLLDRASFSALALISMLGRVQGNSFCGSRAIDPCPSSCVFLGGVDGSNHLPVFDAVNASFVAVACNARKVSWRESLKLMGFFVCEVFEVRISIRCFAVRVFIRCGSVHQL